MVGDGPETVDEFLGSGLCVEVLQLQLGQIDAPDEPGAGRGFFDLAGKSKVQFQGLDDGDAAAAQKVEDAGMVAGDEETQLAGRAGRKRGSRSAVGV